jgi:hypothetical protein
MTETTRPGALPVTASQLPLTGSRGQPLKLAVYLAEGDHLREAVNTYRAERGEGSAEASVTKPALKGGECNKPTKSKSYRLPPLDRPSEIPGFPLRDPAGKDIPDYGNMGRVQASRAAQAERRGKKAPLKPTGPSGLRKAGW